VDGCTVENRWVLAGVNRGRWDAHHAAAGSPFRTRSGTISVIVNTEGAICLAANAGCKTWSEITVEDAAQAALVRCNFGNPVHPSPRRDATWLRPPVRTLAQTLYEQRSFDRLAELASLFEPPVATMRSCSAI
jgi:hypothetical protein